MTQPAAFERFASGAGRLGWLSVAIVAAILAGPPARSSGCARCGAPTPELNGASSFQSLSPRQPKRLASRETRPKRLTGELRIASGGSYFVCVRACDGGFFPVSYVGDHDSLEKICQALCPNAETLLYSMPFGGTIEDSLSMSGAPYASLPNAGKFEQAVDQDCSCRRRDQSWAEALAGIEARLQRHPGDILVTPEISEQMSRPTAPPRPQVSVAKAHPTDADALALAEKPDPQPVVLDVNGVDSSLNAATAAVSRETSGIGVEETGGAHYGLGRGQVVEQRGQDGSVRRVRIVEPTLY
ncbi:MAG TPA: DUF2865 domain-containing protein [Roseiarcus sp.]|jgi:hypothetical protein